MLQSERLASQGDVRDVPLVEVSLEYGTLGLMARLLGDLSEAGIAHNELVERSIHLGLSLHKNDTRTYESYVNHLLRVAARLIEDFEITDPPVIAAAMLHDSVEDHLKDLAKLLGEPVPREEIAQRELGHQAISLFASQETADITLEVTNPIVKPGEIKNEIYLRHIKKLMEEGSLKAKVLKNADFTDNFIVPEGLERKKKRKKLDIKQLSVCAFHKLALEENDLLSKENRMRAISVLEEGERRAKERLGISSSP